jgi:hypothetical protein
MYIIHENVMFAREGRVHSLKENVGVDVVSVNSKKKIEKKKHQTMMSVSITFRK